MLGGGNEGSKEDEKLGERKVYSRRSFKGLEPSKSSSNLLREQQQPKVVSDGLSSTKRLHNSGFDVGSDNFSSLSRDGLVVKGGFLRQENKVWISLSMKSKHEALELRRKLEGERDMVRSLMRKIEANEGQKNAADRFDNRGGDKVAVEVGPARMLKPLNQLSVSVYENSKGGADKVEKEKRTPKANKLYRNSEFLLAKDKIPPAESNKKFKSNGKKGEGSGLGMEKFPNQVFKSCNALLERLMKHKHGWVFNKPVDAVGLGLHDYFEIIKNPMDLGTVKDRLTQNWYKSPLEFAEDVRLTFQNAMTYNPKEQDVYLMAEQLSKMFEDKWALIEADYLRDLKITADLDVGSPTPTSRKAPPQSRVRGESKKSNDRSESTYSVDPKRKTMNIAQSGKIIKKRNPSLSQQDDEIEVDIDSVDTETLWELDRFITNYKKSLSKNKRKAENDSQLITGVEQNSKEKITTSVVTENAKGSRADGKKVVSLPIDVEEPGRNDTNQGLSQSSSSSDSGSSSSDSDGESSSADESDGGHSQKN
ncbi:Transcription factor GTE4 [Sesamum alatum]|uniref:Transcription factor GTE4 n=1 Tax=Sesamum alatum TaxID=300844 RepID=A0AAE2CY77_9LAMI|nr:Transcription factor GTE4 [Sesamum alatum]